MFCVGSNPQSCKRNLIQYTRWGYIMSYIGARGLQFTSEEESRHFEGACRLSGHWINTVRQIYPQEALDSIMGSNWNKESPNPAWKIYG